METILEVSIWDHKAGVLAWNPDQDIGIFEFYESFSELGLDIAPLMMPLSGIRSGDRIYNFPALKGETFKGLPGLLADSLPDDFGMAIIIEWFASQGSGSTMITPVDMLCYLGKRAIGALEFKPAIHDKILSLSSVVEIENLVRLADEVLNRRQNFRATLASGNQSAMDILKVGTSAGGAKPKAIIAWNEATNEVRSGQVKATESFTYWIIKFDGIADKKLNDNPIGIGRIEYAYYLMAEDCGINMSESRLLSDGKYSHFMTKRFDRADDGSKLHVQTLCAMSHFDRDGMYSYEQAFEVMRKLHMPDQDMDQMFRRMVFNVAARNHDDHTKNHSFLMKPDGVWELAPAYDLCFSYSPSVTWTSRHQMSLNNKRDDFEYDDLMAVARNTGIRHAKEIIEEILKVVANWSRYADQAGVNPDHKTLIGSMHRQLAGRR